MRTGHNHALPSNPGTQWVVVSAGIAQERVVMLMARSQMPDVDPRSHAPTTTVRGTADGTRRSTVGTLNMFIWAGTGESLARHIASDVPSTSPTQGSNSGAHRES